MKANELKSKVNLKTFHFLLLSVLTAGIYNLLWMYKNGSLIEEKLDIKISSSPVVIALAAATGWSANLGTTQEEVIFIGILSIISLVLFVFWAFKAKGAIQKFMLNEYKIDYKMNPFYTFIFNIYYICFCINELPEEVEKEKVIAEK